MQHLQIAYELGVIMIGFAALVMAGFWAFKTGEAYLRDFFILYSLFTMLLVIGVLKRYLSLNLVDFSGPTWFAISGVEQVLNMAIIAATVHFFLGVFQVRSRKAIMLVFLGLTVVFTLLIFSSVGAALEPDQDSIRLGVGYQVVSGWYLAAFTFLLALGYAFVRRVWRTDKQTFVLGLLLFATVGYIESLFGFIYTLNNPVITRAVDSNFMYSTIPYALYGIFLMVYFLRYYFSAPTPAANDKPSEAFLARYSITEREREIITKVIQGKSNADIAGELVISLATVKTHLHNIYTKTGADSRYDLLARVRAGQ